MSVKSLSFGRKVWVTHDGITESKPILFTTQQANKSRGEVLEARNSDFVWKASRQRRWWTNVPKNLLQ